MGKEYLGAHEVEIEFNPKFQCAAFPAENFLHGVVVSRSKEKKSSLHLEQYCEKRRFKSYVCKGGP